MLGLWTLRNDDKRGLCERGEVFNNLGDLLQCLDRAATDTKDGGVFEWTYRVRFISARVQTANRHPRACKRETTVLRDCPWTVRRFIEEDGDELASLVWQTHDQNATLPCVGSEIRVMIGDRVTTMPIALFGETIQRTPPVDCDVKVGFVGWSLANALAK